MTETSPTTLAQVKCNLEQALKMKAAGAQAKATTQMPPSIEKE